MANENMNITALIITKDEAVNIADCVRSLSWIPDIVILDSFSQDDTIKIAKSLRPDIRVYEHKFSTPAQQYNWGIQNTEIQNKWILIIDADERCSDALAVEIQQKTAEYPGYAGFYLSNKNYFMGKPITHASMFPSWQFRLVNKGKGRLVEFGHGSKVITEGTVGYIYEPINHFSFNKGISAWIDKHNRYSSWEAEAIAQNTLKATFSWEIFKDRNARKIFFRGILANIPLRPLVLFFFRYIIRAGFLDGKAGFLYCILMATYEFQIMLKVMEI